MGDSRTFHSAESANIAHTWSCPTPPGVQHQLHRQGPFRNSAHTRWVIREGTSKLFRIIRKPTTLLHTIERKISKLLDVHTNWSWNGTGSVVWNLDVTTPWKSETPIPIISYTQSSILWYWPCYHSWPGMGCGHRCCYSDRYLEWGNGIMEVWQNVIMDVWGMEFPKYVGSGMWEWKLWGNWITKVCGNGIMEVCVNGIIFIIPFRIHV